MKRIVIFSLVLVFLLAGCRGDAPSPTSSGTQATEAASTVPVTAEPSVEEPPEITLEHQVQYIRTDGYHEDIPYPGVAVLSSTQDLQDYYETYRTLYDLEARSDISSDSTLGFGNICSKYDEEFFREHFLIFVVMEEPSGSVRHEVRGVYRHPSEGICIWIDRLVPEVGTDDMAQWHIILELDRQWAVDTPGDVRVEIDGRLAWDGNQVIEPLPEVTFSAPPEGLLFTPTGEYALTLGGYHWTRPLSDGTMESVVACQAERPLPRESLDLVTVAPEHARSVYIFDPTTGSYEPTNRTGYLVKLSWEVMPDTVQFTCWGDGVWDNSNVMSENVDAMEDFSFYAKEGAHIYEITVTWKDLGGGSGGSAQYYTYIFGGAEADRQ